MTPEQEKEFNSRIDDIEKQLGRQISKDEFTRLHGKYVTELSSAPKQAPEGFQTIDTALANRPLVKAFGAAKKGIEGAYSEFEKNYPTAAIGTNALLALASLPATALYGVEDMAAQLMDVDPDKYRLSKLLPKTAQSLEADPSVRDVVNAGLLMKGPMKIAPEAGIPTKIAKGTYNAAIDPIGSVFKLPQMRQEALAKKDAAGRAKYAADIERKVQEYAAKEKPSELTPEDMEIVKNLQTDGQLPLQLEASRRLQNTLQGLGDIGRENANISRDIVKSQPFTLTDADVMALSKHPEFAGHPDIKRMAENMAMREKAQPKISLPEGGKRQPLSRPEVKGTQNPPTETLSIPMQEVDAAQAGLLPDEYKGLYSVEQPVPQRLRKTVEQPPLRAPEDVAGTGGPISIDHQYGGILPQPEIRVPEGAEPLSLGSSQMTREGVAIPRYELNPQENLPLSYAENAHVPEDFYSIRQAIDDKNWRWNAEKAARESIDPDVAAIANRMRDQYQSSKAPLPTLSDAQKAHIQKALDAENARIAEANKTAPPEAKMEPLSFPQTIGEATTLLNKDTVRAFEQQARLSPSMKNEKELALMDRMSRGDDKALAEDLRITRQLPELYEYANRIGKAKGYIKDMESYQAKVDRLKGRAESLPYSQVRDLSDPMFLDDFAKSMFFWGPEATIKKYAALKGPGIALDLLGKANINPQGPMIRYPRAFSGPYGLMKNSELTYEGERNE